MTYRQTSIANIKSLAAGIGQEITRSTAIASLTGHARKSAACNNPLNDVIVQYRRVGQWIVELALVDFTGSRGVGKYCCGVTVFSNHELSECIDIEQIGDKLRTVRETIAPLVIAEYGESDSVAMNEAFNNWADSLCKDGTIHPEQYNNYCYVGKWSD